MNCGDIFGNTLKGRCIESGEGQALTKMPHMWAAHSATRLTKVGCDLTKAHTQFVR
jgi:hypothetical protein